MTNPGCLRVFGLLPTDSRLDSVSACSLWLTLRRDLNQTSPYIRALARVCTIWARASPLRGKLILCKSLSTRASAKLGMASLFPIGIKEPQFHVHVGREFILPRIWPGTLNPTSPTPSRVHPQVVKVFVALNLKSPEAYEPGRQGRSEIIPTRLAKLLISSFTSPPVVTLLTSQAFKPCEAISVM